MSLLGMLTRGAFLAMMMPVAVQSAGLHFGLVAKSADDVNFVTAWRACQQEAARSGDRCTLIGPRGASTPRLQLHALQRALAENRFDALAISVTKSNIVARALRETNLPVITYDSPFEAGDQHLSQAYIGTDNLAFGRDLGQLAQHFKPDGGHLCLMSAAHDQNLAQRVLGVRLELSGDYTLEMDTRLTGQGGWIESARCPWETDDSPERTEQELRFTLTTIKPDLFISVGHWPVVNPAHYRETIPHFQKALRARDTVMIVGVGAVTPGYQALLDDNLVHGLVSIDFQKIGLMAADYMRRAIDGEALPPKTFIPNKGYSAANPSAPSFKPAADNNR